MVRHKYCEFNFDMYKTVTSQENTKGNAIFYEEFYQQKRETTLMVTELAVMQIEDASALL